MKSFDDALAFVKDWDGAFDGRDKGRFAAFVPLERCIEAGLEPKEDMTAEQWGEVKPWTEEEVLKQLKMFPVVQLILVGVFLLVSYLIFSTFRKAEQNQVWVGMAKETAHQLGTPLSSLMAWSAYLETQGIDALTINELNKDIDRLNTITDRFSKIGSHPEFVS